MTPHRLAATTMPRRLQSFHPIALDPMRDA